MSNKRNEKIEKTIVKSKYPGIGTEKVSKRQMEIAEKLDEKFCDEFKRVVVEQEKAYGFAIKFLFICILLGIGSVITLIYYLYT